MAVLCRDLRKYLFLREDTCRYKPWRCRALACSATASPREGRFDQTTSCAANFSSARSTTHNWGMLRLGIVRPIRQSCGHAEPRVLVAFPFHHVVLGLAMKTVLRTEESSEAK